MRKHISHIVVAVGIAAVAVACVGGTTVSKSERREQNGGEKRASDQRVAIQGCVGPAASGKGYILRQVDMAGPAHQPFGQELMEHGPLIERGSWVRLAGNIDDIKPYEGKRVAITGDVIDSGKNTLGTSGRTLPPKEATDTHGKYAQSSKDADTNPDRTGVPSSVAPVGADANGNAPEVAVETVKKIADQCTAESSKQ
jgi:hypothetical protein